MKRSAVVILALTLALGPRAFASAQMPSAPVSAAPGHAAAGSFAKLAEAVKPAVLHVSTESKAAGARTPLEEFYGDEFFKRFFGDAPEKMPRRGLGSGVIIDPSGIALTNAHVVDGATSIEVVTLDGAKHKAKLLGVDKKTDLAVLQLDGGRQTFPFVPLGDSNETQVGDWVIAVGSPFGLQATVTSGIISAKARQIGAGPYDDFLQTDAAINPGNSGGPLVNMRGQVVGINTAIVRGGSGIGFAIPINRARRVAQELRTTGTVTRGWLGVSLQPLTSDLATSFGVKDGQGALVADVMADSPAAHAGLKPGDTSRLTVWRDHQEKKIDLKLAGAPAEPRVARGTDTPAAVATATGLGLQLQPLTPDIARELSVDRAAGVVVSGVAPSGPAAQAGIERGDVIVEVDRKPVKTVADFQTLTAGAAGKQILFRIQRRGGALYVALASRRTRHQRGSPAPRPAIRRSAGPSA